MDKYFAHKDVNQNAFLSMKVQVDVIFNLLSHMRLVLEVVVQCGSKRYDDLPRANESAAPLHNLRAVEVLP